MRELHDYRTVFRDGDGGPLRLVDYVRRLREDASKRAWIGNDPNILDVAYDLTLDKFCRLPQAATSEQVQGRKRCGRKKATGPDCRRYFKAFLRYTTKRFHATPLRGELDREVTAARFLQRFVSTQFERSCLEATRRARRLMRRYTWRLEDRVIRIWMPTELTGQQCRRWLEAHTAEVDLTSPHAEESVQAIVKQQLGNRKLLHFSDVGSDAASVRAPATPLPPRTQPLADFVAKEKAEQIDLQRRSIGALGPLKLTNQSAA